MSGTSSSMSAQELWNQATADTIEINAAGRIIDYLDPAVSRLDTREERVRQSYGRILVEEYHYPKEWLAFEAPINIGSETKYADIVVYDSPASRASRDQGRILLIVETKEPTKTAGRRQLTSYIFASSASGGVWTNGGTPVYFRRIGQPHAQLREWPNIPRFGETWDTVGQYRKSELQPPRNLKLVFQRCHNAIYRIGLDSEDIAMDMVRIILAKYRDEQNLGDLCEFRCTPDEFENAAGRKRAGDRVRSLFRQVVDDYPDVFSPEEQITIGDDGLATVVSELQPFRFLADDQTEQVYDIIGTAFEVYVATHLKGDRGQYFTNRLVINMMVEMLDPRERDICFDPACGSGGFLIACLRHVRHRIVNSGRPPVAVARELERARQRLFGIDISPKLVRVAKTNMILNGDGHGGIVRGNSLSDLSDLPRDFRLHPDAPNSTVPTIILTNPPFGASHELRIKDRSILENFSLGHIWGPGPDGWMQQTDSLNDGEGVPPEILFLERCIEYLGPGGKLAIVIARGVLDNREALATRQYILRKTRLLGVINCHPNTFAPFNGTKAAILIIEKKASSGFQRDEDYPVFMAMSQRVGQDSQGREIYKTDANGSLVIINGQRVLDHDMNEITDAWRKYRAGQPIVESGEPSVYDAAWTVPLSRLVESPDMRLNPLLFAPSAEQALGRVLELADSDDWQVERLGDFASVFNGPRFKRPFADKGVRSGDGIVRMYTPKAFFEERGESSKYLDLRKAKPVQQRAIDVLTLERDWILIVDSGTAGKLLGRVGMTTAVHEGAVGNNNLIRIVIEDPVRRDYVYQFLRSELGQTLLLRNVYGTNQDHIEPDHVKDIPIPIPRDSRRLEAMASRVREVVGLRERAARLDQEASEAVSDLMRSAFEANQMELPAVNENDAEDEE